MGPASGSSPTGGWTGCRTLLRDGEGEGARGLEAGLIGLGTGNARGSPARPRGTWTPHPSTRT